MSVPRCRCTRRDAVMAESVDCKRQDGGGAVGGFAAPPAASALDRIESTPPLTNRGCFMPSGDVRFHLDYLKLSVFSNYERVLEIVESALLERAGLEAGG